MGLTAQTVMANVRTLQDLMREIGTLAAPLAEARAQQGPGTWSSIPACAAFGQRYADNLETLALNLERLSQSIATAARNLLDNAEAMEKVDEATRETLMALARSAEATAPLPAPAPTTTPTAPASIPATSGNEWGRTP